MSASAVMSASACSRSMPGYVIESTVTDIQTNVISAKVWYGITLVQ